MSDLASAPASVKVRTLMEHHPDYNLKHLHTLWSLYKGGEHINPQDYIKRRYKEPEDRYKDRIDIAYYVNYVGEIVDYYVSNLFLDEPKVTLAGKGQVMSDYYDKFINRGCDGKRKEDLNAYMRARWRRALVQGKAWTWVDMPAITPRLRDLKLDTAADLDEYGLRDAYLIPVDEPNVLDYDVDSVGALNSVKLYFCRDLPRDFLSPGLVLQHEWVILSRDEFVRYTIDQKFTFDQGRWKADAEFKDMEEEEAHREGEVGTHPFGVVPMVPLCLPEAVCLGEKLYQSARHVYKMDTAIACQQNDSLYAMPVIKTENDFNQMVGDGYYIHLNPLDDFSWNEPEGHALKSSLDSRDRQMEEMFRVSHVMGLALKAAAQTAARSGDSKRRDYSPTQTVLFELGALAKDHYRECLEMVQRGRGEENAFQFETAGFSKFDVEDRAKWLEEELIADGLGLDQMSETFAKEQAKRRIRKINTDLSEEQLKVIDVEIDAAEIQIDDDGDDNDDLEKKKKKDAA